MFFLYVLKEKGMPVSRVFESEIRDITTSRFSINFDDVIEERRQWCFNEDLLKTLNKNYAPEIDEEALAILEKCIDFYGKNLIDINKIGV